MYIVFPLVYILKGVNNDILKIFIFAFLSLLVCLVLSSSVVNKITKPLTDLENLKKYLSVLKGFKMKVG